MAVCPIVRYMLLCDDWRLDPENRHRLVIDGLMVNVHSTDDPPFPLYYEEFCVFLMLTECRGLAEAQIVCVFEETGAKVFETPKRKIPTSKEPLDVVGLPFRIRDSWFPQAGVYSIQFWYDGILVEERPLRMR